MKKLTSWTDLVFIPYMGVHHDNVTGWNLQSTQQKSPTPLDPYIFIFILINVGKATIISYNKPFSNKRANKYFCHGQLK